MTAAVKRQMGWLVILKVNDCRTLFDEENVASYKLVRVYSLNQLILYVNYNSNTFDYRSLSKIA